MTKKETLAAQPVRRRHPVLLVGTIAMLGGWVAFLAWLAARG